MSQKQLKKVFSKFFTENGKLAIIISILEILIGLFFLVRGIYLYPHLFSYKEADEMFGGLADFYIYKEDIYCQVFLNSIILLAGISIWINKKSFWFLNQIILIIFLSTMPLLMIADCFFSPDLAEIIIAIILVIITTVILLSIFILINRKINNENYLLKIGVTNKLRVISQVLGVICSAIYSYLPMMI